MGQTDDQQRYTMRATLLHAADISNQAKAFRIASRWTRRALAEMFAQGDEEKILRLPVSPLCDREATNVGTSQIAFITFYRVADVRGGLHAAALRPACCP